MYPAHICCIFKKAYRCGLIKKIEITLKQGIQRDYEIMHFLNHHMRNMSNGIMKESLSLSLI